MGNKWPLKRGGQREFNEKTIQIGKEGLTGKSREKPILELNESTTCRSAHLTGTVTFCRGTWSLPNHSLADRALGRPHFSLLSFFDLRLVLPIGHSPLNPMSQMAGLAQLKRKASWGAAGTWRRVKSRGNTQNCIALMVPEGLSPGRQKVHLG